MVRRVRDVLKHVVVLLRLEGLIGVLSWEMVVCINDIFLFTLASHFGFLFFFIGYPCTPAHTTKPNM